MDRTLVLSLTNTNQDEMTQKMWPLPGDSEMFSDKSIIEKELQDCEGITTRYPNIFGENFIGEHKSEKEAESELNASFISNIVRLI